MDKDYEKEKKKKKEEEEIKKIEKKKKVKEEKISDDILRKNDMEIGGEIDKKGKDKKKVDEKQGYLKDEK